MKDMLNIDITININIHLCLSWHTQTNLTQTNNPLTFGVRRSIFVIQQAVKVEYIIQYANVCDFNKEFPLYVCLTRNV